MPTEKLANHGYPLQYAVKPALKYHPIGHKIKRGFFQHLEIFNVLHICTTCRGIKQGQ